MSVKYVNITEKCKKLNAYFENIGKYILRYLVVYIHSFTHIYCLKYSINLNLRIFLLTQQQFILTVH